MRKTIQFTIDTDEMVKVLQAQNEYSEVSSAKFRKAVLYIHAEEINGDLTRIRNWYLHSYGGAQEETLVQLSPLEAFDFLLYNNGISQLKSYFI